MCLRVQSTAECIDLLEGSASRNAHLKVGRYRNLHAETHQCFHKAASGADWREHDRDSDDSANVSWRSSWRVQKIADRSIELVNDGVFSAKVGRNSSLQLIVYRFTVTWPRRDSYTGLYGSRDGNTLMATPPRVDNALLDGEKKT